MVVVVSSGDGLQVDVAYVNDNIARRTRTPSGEYRTEQYDSARDGYVENSALGIRIMVTVWSLL